MRYETKRYDVSADDKIVIIDDGDIIVGYDETADELVVLKPLRKR